MISSAWRLKRIRIYALFTVAILFFARSETSDFKKRDVLMENISDDTKIVELQVELIPSAIQSDSIVAEEEQENLQ